MSTKKGGMIKNIGKMIREFKKSVSGIESEADNKNVEDKKEKECK